MFLTMKKITLLITLLGLLKTAEAQKPLIHAHNDYEKQRPLSGAMMQKAEIIEADVFPVDGVLYVAHEKKEINKDRTLLAMYVQPIIKLFLNNGGNVSRDSSYTFALCIDIKENHAETIRLLTQLLQPYLSCFDRSANKKAVQIIISGDRGEIKNWKNYPSYIYFDGRPYEQYDEEALNRIAMISDSYQRYPSQTKLKETIEKVRSLQKPVRLWAAPDNKEGWKDLLDLGAGVINTDHPEAARKFIDETYSDNTSKRKRKVKSARQTKHAL